MVYAAPGALKRGPRRCPLKFLLQRAIQNSLCYSVVGGRRTLLHTRAGK